MKICQISGEENQKITCKPLGYQKENLQIHLQGHLQKKSAM
jgi:hypothetical protein